ncbi:MAG: hypothetical protein SPF56_10475 [Bacteroidaceae bacterium]|nr:hypothetical protein [Prevotellaceae bacterium]MDY5632891.1 hypothetical protein [Bacteroidaceae bacterium]
MDKTKIFITACLGLTLIGCGQSKEEQERLRQLEELAEVDRLEMQNEYEDFVRQYNELQTQITNDSLVAQLENEQRRVRELLAELKQTKKDDAAEILRLKKELATLRAILRNYVMQIDSLNRLNQELQGENQNLRTQNQQAQQHISSLSAEKESLTDKVAIASQLDANGINAIAKNKKGKAARKIKDVKQFQLNFNIARNVTAQTGMKSIYVRILTPTGNVLTQGGTFAYENRQLEYSIRKDVEYTGENLAVSVYWDVNETLSAGTYRFDIFADGHNIGSTTISVD